MFLYVFRDGAKAEDGTECRPVGQLDMATKDPVEIATEDFQNAAQVAARQYKQPQKHIILILIHFHKHFKL